MGKRLPHHLWVLLISVIFFSGCTNRLIDDSEKTETVYNFPADVPLSHTYYINNADDLQFKIDKILNVLDASGGTNMARDTQAVFYLTRDIEYSGGPLVTFDNTGGTAHIKGYLNFNRPLYGNGNTITINGGPLFATSSSGAAFDGINIAINMTKFPQENLFDSDSPGTYRLRYAGALVGSAQATNFSNIAIRGRMQLPVGPSSALNSITAVGGIAGVINNGTGTIPIAKCGSSVDITVVNVIDSGDVIVGGIAGIAMGSISCSYYASSGAIEANSKKDVCIGGIAGLLPNPDSSVTMSYTNGTIKSEDPSGGVKYAGGIIGAGTDSYIAQCVSLINNFQIPLAPDFTRRIGNIGFSGLPRYDNNYAFKQTKRAGSAYSWTTDIGGSNGADAYTINYPYIIGGTAGFTNVRFYNARSAGTSAINCVDWKFFDIDPPGNAAVWDMQNSYLPIIKGQPAPSFTTLTD